MSSDILCSSAQTCQTGTTQNDECFNMFNLSATFSPWLIAQIRDWLAIGLRLAGDWAAMGTVPSVATFPYSEMSLSNLPIVLTMFQRDREMLVRSTNICRYIYIYRLMLIYYYVIYLCYAVHALCRSRRLDPHDAAIEDFPRMELDNFSTNQPTKLVLLYLAIHG